MHIAEMRRREPFAVTLAETLSHGWTCEFGQPFVARPGVGDGQVWHERRPFSALTTTNPSQACKTFLRDSIRFTPVVWRLPAQWAAGTFAATGAGLALLQGEAVTVNPDVPEAEQRVVLPGNLRVRVFDFERRVVRVMAKVGFPRNGFVREVEVRGNTMAGPFPKITVWDLAQGWFEEPILDAVALPRCSSRRVREAAWQKALAELDAWSAPTARQEDASARARHLSACIESLLVGIEERFAFRMQSSAAGALRRITRRAGRPESTTTVVGHGDLQPGNIMVGSNGSVTIIDWEHSARRCEPYDRLVATLRSRTPRGLAARIARYVSDGTGDVACMTGHDGTHRADATAMFVLEDFLWYLEECFAGPFRLPSTGFIQYARELEGIVEALDRQGTAV